MNCNTSTMGTGVFLIINILYFHSMKAKNVLDLESYQHMKCCEAQKQTGHLIKLLIAFFNEKKTLISLQ